MDGIVTGFAGGKSSGRGNPDLQEKFPV